MSNRISELKQPPSQQFVSELTTILSDISRKLDAYENADELIEKLNTLSGMNYNSIDLTELYSWTSEEEFAQRAAMGMPPRFSDLSRNELVEIIGIIGSGEEPYATFFMDLLNQCYPNSWSSDLLFWPHRVMTDEEIVDELLLRTELYKSGGNEAVDAHLSKLALEVLENPDSPKWAQHWASSFANGA